MKRQTESAAELSIMIPESNVILSDSFRKHYHNRLVSPTLIMQDEEVPPPGINGLGRRCKSMADMAIQTELTGSQVETKSRSKSRTRILSGDSGVSYSTDISTTSAKGSISVSTCTNNTIIVVNEVAEPTSTKSRDSSPKENKDSSKVPSFIRIDSNGEPSKVSTSGAGSREKVGKTRRKRRRKSGERVKRHITPSSDAPSPPRGAHLEVASAGSGSSGECLEEGSMFSVKVASKYLDNFKKTFLNENK